MSKNINLFQGIILLLPIFLYSCIIVKEKQIDEEFQTGFSILPKSEIPLSDIYILSPLGDMIAYLPKDWFLIDSENKTPSNVFSVAVDPEYSFCAVFSRLATQNVTTEIVKKEGLLGVATLSFEQRMKKSLGNIELIGDYTPIKNGKLKFYVFKFKDKNRNSFGKTAVFVSSLNQCYEFSLLPLNFKSNRVYTEEEFDKFFFAILTTIQY